MRTNGPWDTYGILWVFIGVFQDAFVTVESFEPNATSSAQERYAEQLISLPGGSGLSSAGRLDLGEHGEWERINHVNHVQFLQTS